MDKIKMGIFLAELRKEKDLSQNSLAEIIGVTFQAVSKWERGEAIPDIAILEKLSSFYLVSIDEIIKGERVTKEEAPQQKVEVNENSGFLNQKRFFGLVFSIAYLILFLLIGICPFAQASNYNACPNYYQIVFSSYYKWGNIIFLIQFLTTIAITTITMLFCVCKEKHGFVILYRIRFVLLIINLLTLIYSILIRNSAIGKYLLIIIIVTFDILYFCLKNNRKKYIIEDYAN